MDAKGGRAFSRMPCDLKCSTGRQMKSRCCAQPPRPPERVYPSGENTPPRPHHSLRKSCLHIWIALCARFRTMPPSRAALLMIIARFGRSPFCRTAVEQSLSGTRCSRRRRTLPKSTVLHPSNIVVPMSHRPNRDDWNCPGLPRPGLPSWYSQRRLQLPDAQPDRSKMKSPAPQGRAGIF
jgi:hypothetical protein